MSLPGGPGERVVVVSPHLDDAVLSLGAAIASWARTGSNVLVLSVLACDPGSEAPAGGWDRRAGFRTEGDAAQARREEDRAAGRRLGAAVSWLPFGSGDYDRHGDEDAVFEAVAAAVDQADVVLLPGAPLTQPDHSWLTRLLVSRLPSRQLGFYAEQPYRARADGPVEAPHWLVDALGSALSFEGVRVGRRDRLAKLRAIRRYRSQLGLLGLDGRLGWPVCRLLLGEARRGGEAVSWRAGTYEQDARDR